MTVRPRGFEDHFSGHAEAYRRFRPEYPDALFAWLADAAPATRCAWDCGTGNGQAAGQLARYFARVVATDASPEQLALAPERPSVSYRVARAEASGLDTASVDLITVAQAVHWFDLPAFYGEARRVARPGGVIALWTYSRAELTATLDAVLEHYYRDVVGPHWPPQRRWTEEGYRTLPFPFPELEPPRLRMCADWTLDELVGYAGTWSATRRYAQSVGRDPLPELASALAAHWGEPGTRRRVTWPLHLRVGKVSG